MAKTFVPAHVWSRDDLVLERQKAIDTFIRERKEEGPVAFENMYRKLEPDFVLLFKETRSLLELNGSVFMRYPQLMAYARYLCGPPVSECDLNTFTDGAFNPRKPEPQAADDAAAALRIVLDPVRFPWVTKRRSPTASELAAALMATVSLMAVENLRTIRRTASSKVQEEAVAKALEKAGYKQTTIGQSGVLGVLDELPRRSFSREAKVGGVKCDVPVRLADGRLLAVECKVSNSAKNSWKRLLREAGGKAEVWKGAFGTQAITGVVLAGVYDLSCLERAQDTHHMAIFWQHDLDMLVRFIKSCA